MDGTRDEVVDGLLGRAEALAGSESLLQFALAFWNDPDVGTRFEQKPSATLREFGVKVPRGLSVVPLGTGQLGMPGPDFVPFRIRFSRCRTYVVRDPETGRLRTETVCFGFEIVPTKVPLGPV